MMTPTQTYRRLDFQPPPSLRAGLDSTVNRWIGNYHRRGKVLAGFESDAGRIDALSPEYTQLTEHQLHSRLMELREHFRRGGKAAVNRLIPALAAIREAARRKLGLHPFEVQLAGALALHQGCLAEMATGEGKTLTAGLAAVLAGWTRRPCHIVTVNDYLVERDASWMGELYAFCGVRVGFVTGKMSPQERLQGYDMDVTYVTSKELLADFLRDRLWLGAVASPSRRLIRELIRMRQSSGVDGLVMRGLHSAIVDEADAVLIDEAVTPLIISSPHKNSLLESAVQMAWQVAEDLRRDEHYEVDARYREIRFTGPGRQQLSATCANLPGIWRGFERRDELVRQALTAREFYRRNQQYIVADDKVLIVDEFTGRQMPNRTWRQGLHQAIEAKEKLSISDPTETIARLSFQRFFRCFRHLSGMTGTAKEAAREFWQIYNLPVVSIPPNRPCIRAQQPMRIFPDQESKLAAVVEEIKRIHATGRPVLVGTRSVQGSEKLAALLSASQLECNVLNAIRHHDEAATIAVAGERGRITIATNMAGRGTDIKTSAEVRSLGGLHVVATELHESGRVDRQLYGRTGRQGEPGSARAFASINDELLEKHLTGAMSRSVAWAVHRRLGGWEKLARAAISAAQYKAQNLATQQRQTVLNSDNWLDEKLSFAGLDVV